MAARILLLLIFLAAIAAGQRHTQNVILITADGLRWQELFGGIDASLMKEKAAGMAGSEALRNRLWRPTAEDRRAALMPFFWGELAPTGLVLGNREKKSSAAVTNRYRVSYPGYSEILTGRAQDELIRGNDPIRNPSQTVLEFLRARLKLNQKQVALFGSWNVFPEIAESRPGTIWINAGYQAAAGSPRIRELSALQFQAPTPWDGVRHDYVTLELALEHMRLEKPRVLYIALGESDDWAHNRRYDRTLTAIEYFDQALRRIWNFIEQSPDYRGRTSLLVTTDHGRGSRLADWHSHGMDIAGADQIWIAVFGPDTPPTGEATGSPDAFQRDIAPTMLELLGIDYREYKGVTGKPLPQAVRPR